MNPLWIAAIADYVALDSLRADGVAPRPGPSRGRQPEFPPAAVIEPRPWHYAARAPAGPVTIR